MTENIASTYEVIGKLGAGGGGTVYLANHLRLNKQVVLKADKRKITTRPELLRREVDVLKNLNHAYIPHVYDFFVENDTVYTVMDYIEGESLDRPLKRGEKYPQSQVVKWAIQLLEALDYLHSPIHGDPPKGYVHSDIKPANLMRKPNNDICLIDFNIALALGEANVIGCSIGYASPEHYGLDYSSRSETETVDRTVTLLDDENATVTISGSISSPSKKLIVPDVRSDIYSVGATLYHLLSGSRPARDAREVVPLSEKEFSPQIVKIITKAMNPDPDLRYQTAAEMLDDFRHLRENDPRLKRLLLCRKVFAGACSLFLAVGIFASFVGLKRMQTTENWLKLAEYSDNALAEGDPAAAVEYALQALPEEKSLFLPTTSQAAQLALTNALGVYDLSDGFKASPALELPSAPFDMTVSSEGSRLAVTYAYEAAVFDLKTRQKLAAFPLRESALADCLFIDEDRIVYAGTEGITAYDIKTESILWKGEAATILALSADGTRVAAVDPDAEKAVIYSTADGTRIADCDFQGHHMSMAANDIFADPHDSIFCLNEKGNLLAVSFSEGDLWIFDLEEPDNGLIVYETSEYRQFAGGFYGKYFVYAAGSGNQSVFELVDVEKGEFVGGFDSQSPFLLQVDETGVYLANENSLVRLELAQADAGSIQQTGLAYTQEALITGFYVGKDYVLVATDDQSFAFYDSGAHLSSRESAGSSCDFLLLSGDYAVIGSRNEPTLHIQQLENHEEAQFLKYDARYAHEEARVSGDGQSVMLFGYQGFRIYRKDGEFITEQEIPEPEQIFDQQFIRSEEGSWLEVTWYDGTVCRYSAADGTLLSKEEGDAPQKDLYEEFLTDNYRIASSLHAAPEVYDRETGKLLAVLEEESYLTYVTQLGDYLITEYISTDGQRYGILLDDRFQKLAYLPDLCDVTEAGFLFDYPSGNLRMSKWYSLAELVTMGKAYLQAE